MLDYKKYTELEGSDKQIAWAEDIRRGYAFAKYCGKYYKDLAEIYANATEEQKAQVKRVTEETENSDYRIIIALVEESSAKWWIENRNITSLEEMFGGHIKRNRK